MGFASCVEGVLQDGVVAQKVKELRVSASHMLGAYLGRRLALWMLSGVEDFLSLWSGGGKVPEAVDCRSGVLVSPSAARYPGEQDTQ